MASHSTRTVYVSIACDVAIAVAKFAAGAWTHSSAMLAEGVHSVIDSLNGVVLLWGDRASRREADQQHPFGYGKELYFWTLMVAVLIFALGGGASIYQGVVSLGRSTTGQTGYSNYVVLGVAGVFEAITVGIAFRNFRRLEGKEPFWSAVHTSKDPTVFTVLLENIAGLAGVGVAAAGVALARLLHSDVYDGVASILIGVLLASVAVVVAVESKGLLIGEGMDRKTLETIRELVESEPGVVRAGAPMTMYFGPQSILLALDVEFGKELSSEQVTAAIDRLEGSVRSKYPSIQRIFIEAEALSRSGHKQAANTA